MALIAYASTTAARQEPYTKYPNRYNDIIKPKLTDTQKAVCDIVIRMTYGWHKESARISNSMFAAMTGKSIQGVIKAKHQLEEMGLLIVLARGGGKKAGLYMLDLYFSDPERAVRKSTLPQEEQNASPAAERVDTPDVPETSDEPIISQELGSEIEVERETCVEEAENQLPAEPSDESVIPREMQSEIETPAAAEKKSETSDADIAKSQPAEPAVPRELGSEIELDAEEPPAEAPIGEAESHTPETPISGPDSPTAQTESQPEISDSAGAANPIRIEDFEPATTKLSLPPSYSNSVISIYNKNKQTTHPENENSKKDRKRAVAAVCSLFRSWGIKLEPKDYAFIGWCIKHYGIEAVQVKIQIMRFQRSRGAEFKNPLGWLRAALARNYEYSQWDKEVIKAKQRAIREAQRAREQQIERELEIQEILRLRAEAEAMKAELAPQDRAELRKEAMEHILKMAGITEEWISDPLIESVETQILRERRG